MSVSLKNTKTALATLFLATGMLACGSKGDDPQPNPPKQSGLTIVPVRSFVFAGQDGLDATVTLPAREAKLTSVTAYTTSNKAVSMDVSPSGPNKVSFMAESGQEITITKRYDPNAVTQNYYLVNGAKGVLAVSQHGDSTLYQFNGEKLLRTLSNEKYAKQLVEKVTKGVTAVSRPN